MSVLNHNYHIPTSENESESLKDKFIFQRETLNREI